ncbi:hypothetical protein M514_04366, partial [Trichuris suis]
MEKKPTSENLDDRTFSELPRLPEHAPQFTETQHTGQHDASSHASPTVSLRRSQRINKGIPPRRLRYEAEIQLPIATAGQRQGVLDMALSSGRNKQSGPATGRRSRMSEADSDG